MGKAFVQGVLLATALTVAISGCGRSTGTSTVSYAEALRTYDMERTELQRLKDDRKAKCEERDAIIEKATKGYDAWHSKMLANMQLVGPEVAWNFMPEFEKKAAKLKQDLKELEQAAWKKYEEPIAAIDLEIESQQVRVDAARRVKEKAAARERK